MKHLLLLCILMVAPASFTADEKIFVGRITYKYSFADLKGNDITDKMTQHFGREQRYFINKSNYKAYGDQDNWRQLYNGNANTYYDFKGKSAKKYDGATITSQKFIVTNLDQKETVAGYECGAIRVEDRWCNDGILFQPDCEN